MNYETTIKSRWREVKEEIKNKWSKFSQSDIDGLQDNLDGLVGKIVQVYGCAKNRAEREYHEFRVSLGPVLKPAVVKP